jgi:hypothetical protein
MKTLRLLNKKYFAIILSLSLLNFASQSNEPVDIWNLENKEVSKEEITSENVKENEILLNSVYKMQSQKKKDLDIEQDETLTSQNIKIAGLYDPSENSLSMDMWSNSDGEKILNLFNKIKKINLSDDANEILNILLMTNSYFPEKNISSDDFLKIKSEWLIKNNDLKLIENYIFKNQNIDSNEELLKYLVDIYLSESDIEQSCNIFFKNKNIIKDNYLSKFYIYCLINDNKREEAQLQLDLKKETGFKDIFFEKKFSYLMGYETKIDSDISEASILDFHLSHRTNPDFKFDPNDLTSKKIWKYLSTSNLLDSVKNVDLEDLDKIAIIEKATHNRNYTEDELYNLYKRFQFNINQLLSVKQSYKLLPNIEARALLYQGVLITSEIESKLELMKILKQFFIKDGIENAFKDELSKILKEINIEEVPSNYTRFYDNYLNQEKVNLNKITINNKILHQSKLLNYFKNKNSVKNIEKDLNEMLKKIKKDKNYFFSKKDIILLESFKSDGIKISKKYNSLYKLKDLNIPSDIVILIDNNEIGLVLLRLAQIVGEDRLEDLGPETLYFIISALNKLNIDILRNKILLKVLPLKV